MEICWSCREAAYHNYKDAHGIRCPRCGQREKDDPAKARIARYDSQTPVVKTAPVKRVAKRTNTRSKA